MSRRRSRRRVCQTQPSRCSTSVFFERATGLKMRYLSDRYPMIWSPPWRTGSFASVRTTPTSPTWSIFIRCAEPRARDKVNEPLAARDSLGELVEADLRIDFARHVRRHRPRDFRMLARVAEDPHELHVGRLRRHILTLADPRLQEVPARVVDAHAHASLKGLRRHDDGHAVPCRAMEDRNEVLGDMAQPGARDHNAVPPLKDRLELRRSLTRIKGDQGDVRVQGVVHFGGAPGTRQCAIRKLDRAVRKDATQRSCVQGSERIPPGGVHLADLCAAVNLAKRIARLPVHDRHDLAEVRDPDPGRADQVQGGIRGRPIARPLRADHDDGSREIPKHEGQRGRREVERVRPVRDEDAGGAAVQFLPGLAGEMLPVLRLQVLAVDTVDHAGPHIADVEELWHAEDEFLRGHRGMDRTGAVVNVGRDRSARAEHRERRFGRRRRRKPPLDRGRGMLGGHVDGLDIRRGDADVVSVRQLDRQDVLAAEPVMRHECAFVPFAFRNDQDRVALAGFRPVQDGPDAGRVVHGPRNRSARYGLCAAKAKSSVRDSAQVTRTVREILNELRWREPRRLAEVVVVYRDRTRPGGHRTIYGSEIEELERRYFATRTGRLPYYKIEKIACGGETLFER